MLILLGAAWSWQRSQLQAELGEDVQQGAVLSEPEGSEGVDWSLWSLVMVNLACQGISELERTCFAFVF